MKKMKIARLLFIKLLFIYAALASGQSGITESDTSKANLNQLTIYVIRSKVKYDWSSPHSLYKSYMKNASKNIFSRKNYLLGHAFIDLQTVACGERIFTGMRSSSKNEMEEMVFKEHYGLSVLGADIEGRLETEDELQNKLERFSRTGQLAFLVLWISDAAAKRLTEFYKSYKSGIEMEGSPGARYGGAFWPRYKGEGAGCSAFAISFLDLAGILREEFDQWLVKIDIPMRLIGGPYNNNNEVYLKDIRKQKSWTDSDERYEHLELFDPTLMYEWINNAHNSESIDDSVRVVPLNLNHSMGIRIDDRKVPVPEEDSIFIQRDKPSIFIDYYHKKYSGPTKTK
jgi:hypothetical protein